MNVSAATVLVVDASRATGSRALAYLREAGYDAEWVDTGEKAFNRLDEHAYDVLVTELSVGRVDGLRIMSVAKTRNPEVCVVFTTRAPDIELATNAMRHGAYDFQVKPLNLAKLEAVIQRGLAYQQLVLEQVALKQRLDEQYGLGSLVGRSRAMAHVYTAVRQAGPLEVPVLLMGEVGTGKDAVAQAIHNGGPRRDGPFVKLGCANLPATVLEDELFGTEGRAGRIELAEQGTLYLEDANNLPKRISSKLLKTNMPEVRLIFAVDTKDDLDTPLKTPSTITITIPPLRERPEDIPLLLRRCLSEVAERRAEEIRTLTAQAMGILTTYDWPGNLRELRNTVETMVETSSGTGALGVSDIPDSLRHTATPSETISIPVGASMREIERLAIEATYRATNFKKEECAQTLGIGLRTLYRKLDEFDLR